ncbi:hypothetical protein AB833_15565 [Chromatiales bacterium (ex Bugula neritina AB1)]|nr:hypothetical protein AB833_15565 [Chromatiales bacterium (ex Bugula neritina AB1)]
MNHYHGDRTIDGIVVTLNGSPLDHGLHVARFTDQGFEWAYQGPEPRQLALALLLSHGLEPAQAIKLSVPYMTEVVSQLDNTWDLTSSDIDSVLTEIKP